MKSRPVKCPVCGEHFVKEDTDYKMCGNRYVHVDCFDKLRHDNGDFGIYGIYFDDTLVYVGMTHDSFERRWKRHYSNAFGEKPADNLLYKEMRNAKKNDIKITAKPIITFSFDKKNYVGDRDLRMMELALIETNQPRCNVEGRFVDYKDFRKKIWRVKQC